MKVLKSLLIGAIAFTSLSVQAQTKTQKKSPSEKAAHKTGKMTSSYGLSEEQSKKVEAAMNTFMVTTRKIKTDNTTTNDVKKSQWANAQSKLNASMKANLSEEQYKKYISDAAEKQAMRSNKKAERSPEKRSELQTNQMVTDLKLTPEQTEKVSLLNLKVANKIKAVRLNTNLTEKQKKEFIQGNKDNRMGALKAILTTEQYALYETTLAKAKAEKKANRKTSTSVNESK